MAIENKQFAIIGLGTFGMSICKELSKQDAQVLAIDIKESLVDEALAFVSQAVTANCINVNVIDELQLKSYDAVIVSIGDDIESAILITFALKEAGVRNIWVKAKNSSYAKILTKIGANKIITPEQETALKVARTIQNPAVIDYMSLENGISLIEVLVSSSYIGKNWQEHPALKDLDSFLCLKRESAIIKTFSDDFIFEVGDEMLFVVKDDYLPVMLNRI
ncbi:MAG: TrkA family potassium uptake protein [Psittacicella sp.]